jgi:hypothetical protein
MINFKYLFDFVYLMKKKYTTVKDILGILPNLKIDAQKMKDELREEDALRDRKLSKLLRKYKPVKK